MRVSSLKVLQQGRTYVYEVRLVSHVEIMYDRGLIQVRELCHVVGLVELRRIDLVDGVRVNFLLGAIVALHQQPPVWQILHHPSPHKGRGRILKPDIALAREVVLALYYPSQCRRLLALLGYELRRECADWCAVAGRVGTHSGGVGSSKQSTGEV